MSELSRPARVMVSVVILNFRRPDRTLRAVSCLPGALGSEPWELIVVDNASADGSASTIRQACPSARVIEMPANLGFAAGMNAGVREATGDYILLLNSDIEAGPSSVAALVDYVSGHPGVGLAAPLLLDESGEVSRTLLIQPTVWRVIVPGLAKLRYKQWRRRLRHEPLEVEAAEGAALMVTREAVRKAGLLDEDFFFYNEIVEWCMRIRDCGLRVAVVPKSKMTHACGGSSARSPRARQVELKRSEYQLLHKRLGTWVYLAAVARDILAEGVRAAFYGIGTVLSAGRWVRGREKLAVHSGVLRWILAGMPHRTGQRYISEFGSWD